MNALKPSKLASKIAQQYNFRMVGGRNPMPAATERECNPLLLFLCPPYSVSAKYHFNVADADIALPSRMVSNRPHRKLIRAVYSWINLS
jgi:hypothetical protein